MEVFLIVILLAVILYLLAKRDNKATAAGPTNIEALYNIERALIGLQKEIKQLGYKTDDNHKELQDKIEKLQGTGFAPLYTETYTVAADIAQPPVPEPIPEQYTPAEQPEEIPEYTPPTYEPIMPVYEEEELIASSEPVSAFEEQPSSQEPTPPWEEQESSVDRWLRNNPDLEKFIGENLINKIGIAVLVLGIAFFVKYAIDKDWINETGRVCIGLGCGAILVGIAHFLRNSYRSFSSVLAGGGIAVFYFTIAFGFHQYHLMSQSAAFVIMVVITAFAIALSVLYDRLELAIIATIGGFIAPFLLSTGEGNYIVLFTYLIILDAGVLLLAYFKRWPAINIIALAFTWLIFGGWMGTTIASGKAVSYPTAMLFATLFYFIFLAMNMVHQMRNKAQFKPFDFGILLVITSGYFAAGITLLHYWDNGAYQGAFTLLMGMMNLGLAYYVYKSGRADRNLLFLLIGITLTFITLTIPIQLHGHAITLFWSAEFVLLYWLSEYSGIRLFKYSSLLICTLTLISLFMDWGQAGTQALGGLSLIYSNTQGLVTNIVAIAAFTAWAYLLRQNKEDNIAEISNTAMSRVALTIASVILFLTCMFGVNLLFRPYTQSYAAPNVYHRLITELFALALIIIAQKRKEHIATGVTFGALCACFVVMLMSLGEINALQYMVLEAKAGWIHFIMHWADSILLGVLFYITIQSLRRGQELFADSGKILSVVLTLMILAFFSTELMHIYVIAGYNGHNISQLESQYGKAGLTVLWALCSFALMWLGMKHSNKTLRITSLVLFSVVLLKLFAIDISGISEGGKILAFILLGVLLLTVSFMYQKLKKIIIDDKKNEEQ